MTIYMVTHKMRFHLQEVRNIYYYETTVGNPAASEWTDIADEIRADFVSELTGRLTPEWEFYGIDYRIVDTAGLLALEAVPTSGILVGALAEDSVPTQVALLVRVKGSTTKPNQARSYLCGFGQSQVTNSLWLSTTLGDAEDFIDLQSVLNNAGTNPLQRVAAQWNTSHTQVTVTNNISGSPAVGSSVPATQRRRRLGVGV